MNRLILIAAFAFFSSTLSAQTKYDYVGPYVQGYKLIVKNGKSGLADSTGAEVVPPEYDHIVWEKAFIRMYKGTSVREISIGGVKSENFGPGSKSAAGVPSNGFQPPKGRVSGANAGASTPAKDLKGGVTPAAGDGKSKITVIGDDDRITVEGGMYPYRAVGKIFSTINDKGYVCTGSLVSKDLVITNSHCLYDADGNRFSSILFAPDYNGNAGTPQIYSSVYEYYAGTTDYMNNLSVDYAILRLNSSLGTNYGWLGWELDFPTSGGKSVSLAGYPADFKQGLVLAVDKECEIKGKAATGQVQHDCDSYGGASGSPIFYKKEDNSYRIIALHNTGHTAGAGLAWSASTSNGAVPFANIYDTYISMVNAKVSKDIAVHLKNGYSEKIFVSLYYKNKAGNFVSVGWYGVEPGKSNEILIDADKNTDVYCYATTASGTVFTADSGQEFCIDPVNAFKNESYTKGASCSRTDFKTVKAAATFVAQTDGVNYFSFK